MEPLRGDAIVGERGMNAVHAYRRSALCARSCTTLTGSTDCERYPRHRGRRVSHSTELELEIVCARQPRFAQKLSERGSENPRNKVARARGAQPAQWN